MNQIEPNWLTWARELQAISQTGLTFTRDPFDRERYGRLRELASEILSAHTETPSDRIVDLFAEQVGYATPKVEVRAAVFDENNRILMVRETLDDGRWTFPGAVFVPLNNSASEKQWVMANLVMLILVNQLLF